jgi:hypothetical protein
VDGVNVQNNTIGSRKTVRLNGPEWKTTGNMCMQISAFGVTKVDDEFWSEWLKRNPEFPALKSGAIFSAVKPSDGDNLLKTMETEKTGFEPMPQVDGNIAPRKDD